MKNKVKVFLVAIILIITGGIVPIPQIQRTLAVETSGTVGAGTDEFSEFLGSGYESKSPTLEVAELSNTFTSEKEIEVYLKAASASDVERVVISGWSGGAYSKYLTSKSATYDEMREIYTVTFSLDEIVNTNTNQIENTDTVIYYFDACVYGTNGTMSYYNLENVEYTKTGFTYNTETSGDTTTLTLNVIEDGEVAIIPAGEEVTENTAWQTVTAGENQIALMSLDGDSNEETSNVQTYQVLYRSAGTAEVTSTEIGVVSTNPLEKISTYQDDDTFKFEVSEHEVEISEDGATTTMNGWISYIDTPEIFESTIQGMNNETATAQIKINTKHPGILSFDYMVSSEIEYDIFKLEIKNRNDVIEYNELSGRGNWNKFEYKFNEPVNGVITLTYSKDKNIRTGEDKAAIRNLKFTPLLPTNGKIVINSGDEFTSELDLNLKISVEDANYMHIAETSEKPSVDDSDWIELQDSYIYTLQNTENGKKTIYVWFKNNEGIMSDEATTATIKLENEKPTNTAPELECIALTIKVDLKQTDENELKTIEYGYKIADTEDDFTWIDGLGSESYTLNGLAETTEYEIKTRVSDGIYQTTSESSRARTNISAEGIVITKTPNIKTTQDVEVTIDWNNTSYTRKYSLDNITWTEATEEITTIRMNENGTIYYEMTQETSTTGILKYVVDNIDKNGPQIESIGVVKPVTGKYGIDDEITIELKWNEDVILGEAPIVNIKFNDGAIIPLTKVSSDERTITYKYVITPQDNGYLVIDSITGGLVHDALNNEGNCDFTAQTGNTIFAENTAYIPATNTYYSTIKNAIKAAGTTPTLIEVISDMELRETVVIKEGQDITIDLKGNTIVLDINEKIVTAIENNGKLKLIDTTGNQGTLKAISKTKSAYTIINNNTGKLIIENGKIEALSNSTSVALESYAIYNKESGEITLGKDDGTVSTTMPEIKATSRTSNGIKLTGIGGRLYYYDGIIKGTESTIKGIEGATSYVIPAGYMDKMELKEENGVNYVASYLSNEMSVELTMNGQTKYYLTLLDALEKIPTDGRLGKIKLVADEMPKDIVKIYKGQNIEIDLNGHTIKRTESIDEAVYTIINNGTLILKDSTEEKTGRVEAIANNNVTTCAVYNMENGDLTIDGVTLFATIYVENATKNYYGLYNNSTIDIKFYDGKVYNKYFNITENSFVQTYVDPQQISLLDGKYMQQGIETIDGIQYKINYISETPVVTLTKNGVSKGYTTIHEAIDSITDSGEAIIRMEDNEELFRYIDIPEDRNLVIDLNGKNISANNLQYGICTKATSLEVSDNLNAGIINVYYSNSGYTYGINNAGDGSVTIKGVTINTYANSSVEIGTYGINNAGNGSLTITGGTINSSSNINNNNSTNHRSYAYGINNAGNGSLTITGGIINSSSNTNSTIKINSSLAYGINNTGNGSLTITGGTINSSSYGSAISSYVYGINNTGDGSITITGGTINSISTNTNFSTSITSYPVYAYGINNTGTGNTTITGGTINSSFSVGGETTEVLAYGILNEKDGDLSISGDTYIEGTTYGIYIQNINTKVIIEGGIFKGKNSGIYIPKGMIIKNDGEYQKGYVNLSEGKRIDYEIENDYVINFLEEGAIVAQLEKPNGNIENYLSIQNALDNTFEDGLYKIKMLENEALCRGIEVNENQNIKIDLNGKEIYINNKQTGIINNGNLIIEDTSYNKIGTINIKNTNNSLQYIYGIINEKTAKLTLDGVKINTSTNVENILNKPYVYGIINKDSGDVTLTDVVINSKGQDYVYGIKNEGNGYLKVAGGSINCTCTVKESYRTEDYYVYGIVNEKKGKLTLTDVIINTNNNGNGNVANLFMYGIINKESGSILITGGTITVYPPNEHHMSSNGYGIDNTGDGSVTITGGTITSTRDGINNTGDGSVTVTGGTITSTRCGINNTGDGSVTVTGGTITSTLYGINNTGDGSVTVTGGTITVTNSSTNKAYGIYNSGIGSITIIESIITCFSSYDNAIYAYGIYNLNKGQIIIGENHSKNHASKTIIKGNYAIYYGKIGADIRFYNGILMGKEAVVDPTNIVFEYNENVNEEYKAINIPQNTYVKDSKDGNYYTKTLIDDYSYKLTYINGNETIEKYYTSLNDAVKNTPTNIESKIVVMNDSYETIESKVASDKNIILDLNGKKIVFECNYGISNNGKLKIIDSSEKGGGIIENILGNIDSYTIYQNSKNTILTIGENYNNNSLNIISKNCGIYKTEGTLNIYDGKIIAKDAIYGTVNKVSTGYNLKTISNGDGTEISFLAKPNGITIVAEKSGWTNENEKITIYYTDTTNINQYKIGDEAVQKLSAGTTEVSFEVDENCIIHAETLDGNDTSGDYIVSNIDKTKPTISNISITTEAGTKQIVTVTGVQDEENGSGLKGYLITMDNKMPRVDAEWINLTGNTFSGEVDKNGTWYAYVIDNAGNISDGVSIIAENIDTEAPIVTNIEVISPETGIHVAGTEIIFNVNWSEEIIVTKAPILKIIFENGEIREATLKTISTNVLTYTYTIQIGDYGKLNLYEYTDGIVKDTVSNDYAERKIELIGNKIEIQSRAYIEETNTYYKTLKEAIDACSSSAIEYTKIKLVNNDSYISESLKIKEGQKIEIDLNGFDVTFKAVSVAIANSGDLIISDTSQKKCGVINGEFDNSICMISNEGNVAVIGGTIKCLLTTNATFNDNYTIYGINNIGDGGITLTEGTIDCSSFITSHNQSVNTHYISIYGINNEGNGNIIITGGVINCYGYGHEYAHINAYGILNKGSGNVILKEIAIDSSVLEIEDPISDYTYGIKNEGAGNVAIEGGTIKSYGEESFKSYGINNEGSGTLSISGDVKIEGRTYGINNEGSGTLSISGDAKVEGGTYGIYNSNINTKVIIEGGEFKGKYNGIYIPEGIQLKNNGSYEKGYVNLLENRHIGYRVEDNFIVNYLEEGKIVATLEKPDGTKEEYVSVQDAVVNVSGDGTHIIKMIENEALCRGIEINENQNIRIDLNGKEIFAKSNLWNMVINDGNLTIEDTSNGENGILNYLSSSGFYVINNTETANIMLTGGTINCYGERPSITYGINNEGSITIIEGSINCFASGDTSYYAYGINNAKNGKVVIKGGVINSYAYSEDDAYAYGINNSESGDAIVAGGTITTYSRGKDTGYSFGINNSEDGNVTITGGTINTSSSSNLSDSYAYGINNSEDGNVTITGGTINTSSSSNPSDSYAYGINNEGSGTLSISGDAIIEGGVYGVYISDINAKVIIEGGEFKGKYNGIYIPEGIQLKNNGSYEKGYVNLLENKHIGYRVEDDFIVNYLAEGNVVATLEKPDGTKEEYVSVQDAVVNASGDGTHIIKMIENEALCRGIEINENQNIKIDLNGKNIYAANLTYTITNEGNLIIEDTSNKKLGKITTTKTLSIGYTYGIYNLENITVTGGTIQSLTSIQDSKMYGIYALDNTNVTITGGTINTSSSSNSSIPFAYGINGGNITVTGGTINTSSSSNSSDSYAYGIRNNGTGNIMVTGGKIVTYAYSSNSSSDIYAIGVSKNLKFTGGKIISNDTTIAGNVDLLDNTYVKKYSEKIDNVIYEVAEISKISNVLVINNGSGDYFDTLEDAMTEANKHSTFTEVKLLADAEITSDVTISSGKNIQLDLNGHTIKYYSNANSIRAFINNGTFELIDSVGGGKLEVVADGYDAYGIYNGISFSYNTASFKQTGGNIEVTSIGANAYGVYNKYGVNNVIGNEAIRIEGGSISVKAETGNNTANSGMAYGVYNINSGSIVITGEDTNIYVSSTFNDSYGIYDASNRSILTLGENDGLINNDSPYISGGTYGIYKEDSSTFALYGGSITGVTGKSTNKTFTDKESNAIIFTKDNLDGTETTTLLKDITSIDGVPEKIVFGDLEQSKTFEVSYLPIDSSDVTIDYEVSDWNIIDIREENNVYTIRPKSNGNSTITFTARDITGKEVYAVCKIIVDLFPPTDTAPLTTSTGTSVTIICMQEDENLDRTQTRYSISSDNGITWSDWTNRSTINGLIPDTEYLVKTKAVDTFSKETESQSTTIRTKLPNLSEFTIEPDTFTNTDVKVIIKWNNPENTSQYYKIDDGEWIIAKGEITELTVSKANTMIYTKLIYNGIEDSEIKSIKVENIDRLAPRGSFTINETKPHYGGLVTLNIETSDDTTESGDNTGIISYIYISEENIAPKADNENWVRFVDDTNAYPYTIKSESGDITIYMWFMDKAKNISKEPASDEITFVPPIVVLIEDDIVIGEYDSIELAYAAARENNQNASRIIVCQDTTLDSTLTIASTKNIILDLNGKTVTSTLATGIRNEGTLEITDSRENGKYVNTYYSSATYGIYNTNNLTISSGDIQMINNTSGSYSIFGIYNTGSMAIINITGGRIYAETTRSTSSSSSNYPVYAIYNNSSVTSKTSVKITGGIIETNALNYAVGYGIYNVNSGKIEIENIEVMVNAQYRYSYGIYKNGSGAIIINSGSVESNSTSYSGFGIYNNNSSNSVTIGSNDGVINNKLVTITGSTSGIYRSSGTYYFYDGTIKGTENKSINCNKSYLILPTNYGIIKTIENSIETSTLLYDDIAPTIENIEITNDTNVNEQTITVKGVTDEGTGIVGYYFSKTSTPPTKTSASWTTVTQTKGPIEYTYTVTENIPYYFWAIDSAGNVSETYSVTAENIKIKVTGITLNNISLNVGESKLLNQTLTPSGAEPKSISFISSDESIAYVNPITGEIIGISKGNATINCLVINYDNTYVSKTCNVKVTGKLLEIITEPQDRTVKEGTTVEYIVDASGANLEYQWYQVSGDSEILLTEDYNKIYKSNIEGEANTTVTDTIIINRTCSGELSFEYMVSSEAVNDTFSISIEDINGERLLVDNISGEVDWTNYTAEVTPNAEGKIILTLTYTKNDSIDGGLDYGAIRNLSCYYYELINKEATFDVAKDVGSFEYSTGGSYEWVKYTDSTGDIAFKSSNYNKNSTTSKSTITLKTELAGTLSFDWMVSSESGYDKLTITINGVATEINAKSGSISWTNYTQEVTPIDGEVIITVSYVKDGSTHRNSDIGSIKNLIFEGEGYVTSGCAFVTDDTFTLSSTNYEIKNYTGTNTPTLQIPGSLVTENLNNTEYYCEVSNTNDTATSRNALLTVAEEEIPFNKPITKTAPSVEVGYKEIKVTCNQTGDGITNTYYAISTDDETYGEWQESNVFTNLEEGTRYFVKTKGENANGEQESVSTMAIVPAFMASLEESGEITYYESVQDAINAANSANPSEKSKVTLLHTETRNTQVTIVSGKNISLDLNGNAIEVLGLTSSNIYGIYNQGEIEILDSIGEGEIKVVSSYISSSGYVYGIYNVNSSSILNLISGTISASRVESYLTRAYAAYNGYGTMNIGTNDGTVSVTSPKLNSSGYGLYRSNGTINFYDGLIISNKENATYGTITPAKGYDIKTEDLGSQTKAYLEKIAVNEAKAMVMTWEIPANTTIKLPIDSSTNMNIIVDWGDGVIEQFKNTTYPSHKYTEGKTYTIKLSGTVSTFGNYSNSSISSSNNNYTFTQYLKTVEKFGELGATRYGFANCINIETVSGDVTQNSFENVTNMSYMFYNCAKLTSIDVSKWDTSKVTDMSYMFGGCSLITSLDLSNFNTEKVTEVKYMFENMNNLQEIKIGDNFEFKGTTVETGSLPTPSSDYIQDADGYWYDKTTNIGYLPAEVPSKTAATYTAINPVSGSVEIVGNNKYRETLTVDTSNITPPGGELTYEWWYADSANATNGTIISGETSSTYKIGTGLVGKYIGVTVKLANTSKAFTDITDTTVEPKSKEGVTVTLEKSLYQYDGEEKKPTVIVKDGEDVLANSDYEVTYSNNIDVSEKAKVIVTLKGNYTGIIEKEFTIERGVGTATVSITGKKYVGGTITANVITESDGEVSYQWWYSDDESMATGTPIEGATNNTYVIKQDLLEKYVGVTASVAQGTNYTACTASEKVLVIEQNKFMITEWTLPEGGATITLPVTGAVDLMIDWGDGKSETVSGDYPTHKYTSSGKKDITIIGKVDTWGLNDVYTNAEGTILSITSDSKYYAQAKYLTGLKQWGELGATRYGFSYCENLKYVSGAARENTFINVNDMSCMFYGCISLEELDATIFNTSKVTNMMNMFYDCSSLTNLDVSKFNTSLVENMQNMFRGCSSIEALDVSGFDTSKVTTMDEMFKDCRLLTPLDVSNFNTSSVTNMNGMFSGCNSLTSLDLSNFDTTGVTTMQYMIQNAAKLESIMVSNNFVAAPSSDGMFSSEKLKAIIIASEEPNGDQFAAVKDQLAGKTFYVQNASEGAYEEAFSASFTEDKVEPILQVSGEETITLLKGTSYEEKNFTVAGFGINQAENYLVYGYNPVAVSGDVNTNEEGKYNIEYTLTRTYKSNGETISEKHVATRTVNVVDKPNVVFYENGKIYNGEWTSNSIVGVLKLINPVSTWIAVKIGNGEWGLDSEYVDIAKSGDQIAITFEKSMQAKVLVREIDASGKATTYETLGNMLKIDKDIPEIKELTYVTENGVLSLKAKVSDEISGVTHYQITMSNAVSAYWKEAQTNEIVSEVTSTGTYFFRVKDAAGNIASKSIDAKKDVTPPKGMIEIEAVNIVSGEQYSDIIVVAPDVVSGEKYTNKDVVKINIIVTDNETDQEQIMFALYNEEDYAKVKAGEKEITWQTYAPKVEWPLKEEQGKNTIYAIFKDIAGNTTMKVVEYQN